MGRTPQASPSIHNTPQAVSSPRIRRTPLSVSLPRKRHRRWSLSRLCRRKSVLYRIKMSFKQMFGQVVNFAVSSIPVTEAYAYKVRQIDNPSKRHKDWPLICTQDSMKLVHDVKNKQYEAVLMIMRADGKQDTYSIFKLQEGEKTRQEFEQYHDKLHPFYASCPYALNLNNLQELCTVIKEHPNWSVAHVGVAAKIKGCYRVPQIQKELNSQQCDLQQTPLHLAVESGQSEIVHELLLCGVSVDVPDVNGENAFHAVAKLPPEVGGSVSALADQLAAAMPGTAIDQPLTDNYEGKGLNRTNKDFLLPLHLALQVGNFELVQKFIALGSKVDLPDNLGYPIHYAMKQKQIKMAEVILAAHSSQGKLSCAKHGGTPLHWAKESGFIELVLKQDHDLDALSKTGDTALHVMIKRLRMECALTLLCAGADVNKRGPEGDTALHLAIKKNNLDLVYCLVTFGADVNASNDKGETPRHLASSLTVMSALSSYMGSSSEMLSVLHLIGAKRCEPGIKGCGKGCKFGEAYNGKPPESMQYSPSETQQLYHDTLALTIGKLLSAKIMGEDTVDAPMETGEQTESQKPERHADTILCLDGGGIRGLILVQLLAAIEKAAGTKIVDMFDWIAGTSTGGILGLGLIHGFSVSECKQLYFGLKNAVFCGSRPYSSENLEKFLKEAFGEETTMDSVKHPKIMVTGTLSDRNPPALHLFRNFEASELSSAKQSATANKEFKPPPEPKDQLVWRAARSSGAAPSYFKSCGRFLDGGLISNNPTLDALAEVNEYYMEKKMKREPVRKIGAVVSLGTGDVPIKKVSSVDVVMPEGPLDVFNVVSGALNLGEIFVEQCTEANGRSVDRARAWCFSIGTPFFRFNPPLSTATGLDEARDPYLFRMLWETEVYIQQNQNKIQQLADLLNSL